jgi:secondary thiamine-phosphate synthase enzyme
MSRWLQEVLTVQTRGRGTVDVSAPVDALVARSGVRTGLCHLFLRHTSASLTLCENADPDVRRDLETFFARLVPDGDPSFRHTDEGPDDMSAHLRTVLTTSGLLLPVRAGRCALGTWQGVYLWEHRITAHRRELVVTVFGEAQ